MTKEVQHLLRERNRHYTVLPDQSQEKHQRPQSCLQEKDRGLLPQASVAGSPAYHKLQTLQLFSCSWWCFIAKGAEPPLCLLRGGATRGSLTTTHQPTAVTSSWWKSTRWNMLTLRAVNPWKAAGPGGVSGWVLQVCVVQLKKNHQPPPSLPEGTIQHLNNKENTEHS